MMKEAARKMVTISDFLTQDEIAKCAEIYKAKPGAAAARRIRDEVITPNIERINAALGQQETPLYLAYICEFTIDHAERGRPGAAEFPLKSVEPQITESE